MTGLRALGAWLIGVCALPATAQQPVPVGTEFQVNDYTTHIQNSPSVSTDADGNFVVVWDSYGSNGTNWDGQSIQARRFASDGSPIGDSFQVNSITTFVQWRPSVASDGSGDFVVVWESWAAAAAPPIFGTSVQGQRYASDGTPLGAEFQVSSDTTTDHTDPSVAMDSDGDFVVVWQGAASSGTDSSVGSIQGQRYASSGIPLGGGFQVNTFTTGWQIAPSVALDSDGDFVVVWQSAGSGGSDSSGYSIQGQRYSSDGTPQGNEFQVNTYTTGNQLRPAIASDAAGDFVVVWVSNGSNEAYPSVYDIFGQRYASDGTRLGGEFRINTYLGGFQDHPSVSTSPDGDFIVVWDSSRSTGSDSSAQSIQAQRFASDGTPTGGEFQVNTYTTDSQSYPVASADASGDFVVVWRGSRTPSDSHYGIQGQRYAIPFFADGFESGNTVAWSTTVP